MKLAKELAIVALEQLHQSKAQIAQQGIGK
jgi:hypothetical protein